MSSTQLVKPQHRLKPGQSSESTVFERHDTVEECDDTVDGQIQWTVGSVWSIGFLADFGFDMAVLGVPSGPSGLVAPLGFKILDSQPEK